MKERLITYLSMFDNDSEFKKDILDIIQDYNVEKEISDILSYDYATTMLSYYAITGIINETMTIGGMKLYLIETILNEVKKWNY